MGFSSILLTNPALTVFPLQSTSLGYLEKLEFLLKIEERKFFLITKSLDKKAIFQGDL